MADSRHLTGAVQMFPPPRASDADKGIRTPEGAARERQRRKNGQDLPTVAGGKLNPVWVEALMGYPIGWTDVSAVLSRRAVHAGSRAAKWGTPTWEDGLDRVASGVAHRKDRLKSLGNAVVPQVAEQLGRLILQVQYDAARKGE